MPDGIAFTDAELDENRQARAKHALGGNAYAKIPAA